MTETYTFTHAPNPAILRRDLLAAQAGLKSEFAATCVEMARQFRMMAQDAFDVGDQRRGDQCTARALTWELAGATGNLEWVWP